MKILLTGGAGFIGSNFVRMALTDRLPGLQVAAITVLDALTYSGSLTNLADIAEHDPRYAFVHGDIRDVGLLDRILPGTDVVLHLAAESHGDRSARDASLFVETNVVGTQRLLDAALRHGVRRFVHVSTDEVYGATEQGSCAESHRLEPSSPYSASKAASDLLVRSYHRTHGLDTRITRGPNNYGPFQLPEERIPLLITELIDDRSVSLPGDEEHVRDWLHVEDHCRGIALVLAGGRPGEVYNIGGGTALTDRELTERLLEATGRDWSAVQQADDRKGHDSRRSVDIAKIRDELGYLPQVPFEQGLADVVQWYRDNRAWWEPLKERASL